MTHAGIAAIETDMAVVVRGKLATDELDALGLRALQAGLLNAADAERVFGALAQVRAGLGVHTKWLGAIRKGCA